MASSIPDASVSAGVEAVELPDQLASSDGAWAGGSDGSRSEGRHRDVGNLEGHGGQRASLLRRALNEDSDRHDVPFARLDMASRHVKGIKEVDLACTRLGSWCSPAVWARGCAPRRAPNRLLSSGVSVSSG